MIEKDKNLDLGCALGIAADVQPIKVDAGTINEVRKMLDTHVTETHS